MQLREKIRRRRGERAYPAAIVSNYQFKKAHELFAAVLRSARRDADPYRFDLLQVSCADSQAGLGNFDSAIATVKHLYQSSHEPQMKLITGSAWGEFLFRSGETQAAIVILRETGTFLAADDPSTDAGIWNKWMGAAVLKTGDHAQARQHFDQAIQVLCRPGAKPEGWLEVLYFFRELDKNFASFVGVYPTTFLPYGELIRKENPEGIVALGNTNSHDNTIDLTSETHWIKGKAEIPFNKTSHLLGMLALAGTYGIPKNRVLETLWPEQLFSFKNLEDRLHQVLLLPRAKKAEIDFTEHHLWLRSPPRSKAPFAVSQGFKTPIVGRSFFEAHPDFSRREVEEYFKVKKTKAAELIRGWKSKSE